MTLPAYPRIIAHRCGGALAAENTLAGLDAAARAGCRGVEFDVMLSADGVPVLMHDDAVDRTTNGHGEVARLTIAQLRGLRVGGEPVPLLTEAIERCARLRLWANVELKVPAGGDAGTLGRTVGRMLADVWPGPGVVSSFSPEALFAFKTQPSRHASALLFEALPGDWRTLAAELDAAGIHLDAAAATAAQIGEISAAGFRVACYTVNDRTTAARLFASGADAVFTDRPDLWLPEEM